MFIYNYFSNFIFLGFRHGIEIAIVFAIDRDGKIKGILQQIRLFFVISHIIPRNTIVRCKEHCWLKPRWLVCCCFLAAVTVNIHKELLFLVVDKDGRAV